jgi:head-tail adaptor
MAMPVGRLPNLALVQQKTTAADGYGGQVVTWSTRHAAWACRYYRSDGRTVRLASGEDAISTHKFVGEVKEIHAGDRLVLGHLTFEVLGPDHDANYIYDASNAHHVELDARTI